MEHLMIDLETLGTKPGSVILSISAVAFDIKTGKTDSLFHQKIDVYDSEKQGLKIQVDTFLWWLNQSKDAQNTLINGTHLKLRNTIIQFHKFVYDWTSNDVKVWGNSARFDLGILQAAFDLFGYDLPWKPQNERDVRTLVSFAPEIKKETKFEGIPHYGIDDCKHQIKYCSKIYQKLNLSKNA